MPVASKKTTKRSGGPGKTDNHNFARSKLVGYFQRCCSHSVHLQLMAIACLLTIIVLNILNIVNKSNMIRSEGGSVSSQQSNDYSLPSFFGNGSTEAKLRLLSTIVSQIKNNPDISDSDKETLKKIGELIVNELPGIEEQEADDEKRVNEEDDEAHEQLFSARSESGNPNRVRGLLNQNSFNIPEENSETIDKSDDSDIPANPENSELNLSENQIHKTSPPDRTLFPKADSSSRPKSPRPDDSSYSLPSDCVLKTPRDSLPLCDLGGPNLIGYQEFDLDDIPFADAWKNAGNCVADGCFRPKSCKSRQKVAFIIPYKNRAQQLTNLMNHMHPFMQRQNVEYCIFISEQLDDGRFNKGILMNAAFKEAQKVDDFDCFVFHDVDLLPQDDRNTYNCKKETPLHLSALIDKFHYQLHYGTEFGGATAMTKDQYERVNGYSNLFFGWGREDSDMERRIGNLGIQIAKPEPIETAKYKMMLHFHPWRFQNEKQSISVKAGGITPLNPKEKLMLTKEYRQKWDGLKSLDYTVGSIHKNKLFRHYKIDQRQLRFKSLKLILSTGQTYDFDVSDRENTGIDEKPPVCKMVEIQGATLSGRWSITKGTSAGRSKQHKFTNGKMMTKEDALKTCMEIGELCGGVGENDDIRLQKFPTEARWSIREKAVPISQKEGGKNLSCYVKLCENTLLQVAFPDFTIQVEDPDELISYHFEMDFDVVLPMGQTMYFSGNTLFEDTSLHDLIYDEIPLPAFYPLTHFTDRSKLPLNVKTKTKPATFQAINGWWMFSSSVRTQLEQVLLEWHWSVKVEKGPGNNNPEIRPKFLKTLNEEFKHAQDSGKTQGESGMDRKEWLRKHGAELYSNFSRPFEPRFTVIV